MHRLVASIAAIMIVTLVGACDNNSNGNRFQGRTWSASLSAQDAALEQSIIADLMGGIVSSVIEPDQMSLTATESPAAEPPAEESSDVEKISISVPLERSLTSVSNSYEYSSPLGSGTLTISMHGDTEEINVHTEESRKLRFYPLVVTFSFNEFAYVNSCGREATVTGDISCRMHGSVERSSDIADALGTCATGREGLSGTIKYRLGADEEHDVLLQATTRLGGPWYELTSYKFYGTYMLDRRWGTIDSVIAKAPGVCTE